jgi:hypothetical protein
MSEPNETSIARESIFASGCAVASRTNIFARPSASSRAAIDATSLALALCLMVILGVPPPAFFGIAPRLSPESLSFFRLSQDDNMSGPV